MNGDYAWAMTEGIMLAFARDGHTLMIPAMEEAGRKQSLRTQSGPAPLKFKALAALPVCPETLHQSIHERGFDYLENKGKAGPIKVYHLWCGCGVS